MVNEFARSDVRRQFERAARSYNRVAFLQRAVEDRLLERLAGISARPATVVDLGCGPGRSTAALRERFPAARTLAVDFAPAMLHKARESSPGATALCADARHLPLAGNSVDLLYSSLMLQWINDLDALFDELRRIMRPRAVLLFATLGPDTLKELKASWAAADAGTHVHAFMDMHDVGDAVLNAGFSEPVLDVEHLTATYDDARQIMRDLKDIGAQNSDRNRARGLGGKTGLKRVLETYEGFRAEGKLPVTYEVIFAYARAPEESQPRRTPAGHEAAVSVDALRSTMKRGK